MREGVTNLETLHPGHFLNSTGFIENCSCPASFIASNTVLCLFISDTYFKLLSVEHPETHYKLFELIASQICTRIKSIHDIVISFISDLDMTSLSFLDRMVYSLKQPKKIVLEEREINKELFKQSPIFESFNKDEVDILFNHFVILDAPKNCKLLSEVEKNSSCFVVIYGAIQTCIMQNNKLAKLSVIGPGTLLASIGCVDNTSSFNMTYITCEHTILCKLSESELQSIKTDQPELWYKLFYLICGSLAALKKSIDKLDIRLHTETYNR